MSNLTIDTIQARSERVEDITEDLYEKHEGTVSLGHMPRDVAEFVQAINDSQKDVRVLLKVVQTLRGMLDTQMSEALVNQIITEASESA